MNGLLKVLLLFVGLPVVGFFMVAKAVNGEYDRWRASCERGLPERRYSEK